MTTSPFHCVKEDDGTYSAHYGTCPDCLKKALPVPIPREMLLKILERRFLVFYESPEGFRQIILDKRQFAELLKVVSLRAVPTDIVGLNSLDMRLSDDIIPAKLFENMTAYF